MFVVFLSNRVILQIADFESKFAFISKDGINYIILNYVFFSWFNLLSGKLKDNHLCTELYTYDGQMIQMTATWPFEPQVHEQDKEEKVINELLEY